MKTVKRARSQPCLAGPPRSDEGQLAGDRREGDRCPDTQPRLLEVVSASRMERRANWRAGRTGPIATGASSRSAPAIFLRRLSLFGPYSSRGNKRADRRAAQTERWLAGRNPNKSQVFPVKVPNGSRIPLLARSSLPCGKACSALGSNNRVPERTPDRQH